MIANLIPIIFQRPGHRHINQYNPCTVSVGMLFVKVISKHEFRATSSKDANKTGMYLHIP